MSVTFQVEILNEQNNNSVPIDFHLPSGVIKGKCAADRKSEAVISSTIEEADGRLKTLKFVFRTEEMRVKRVDELRWILNKVVYVEKFAGSSAVFESDNSSVIFSAPLTQKYVCEDRINVTLHIYLCERTRKRTLSESLQHRSTVFCGVVLAISSIAHIVGHMLRRHFMPHRKELYENLDRLPAI
ncbi:Protein CBR-UNC-46 [Caenorhabditis briggsae]|uniref:Protein CBR-UNC-46 n=1 Tax=Caenorhabditis briggsae TaxID=6238 RepID=A8X6U4_CAEBR|nr:Protein CBR-UNC-46 [Caenorhabditis briggsae]CAP28355.2 Protein CBR-UNC-46 [Caenorhabditis briggsae]